MNYGVCLEMVFTDRPFLDRIHLAADAGFTLAEMWFGDLMPAKSTGDAGKSKQAAHPGRHELWLGETNYPLLVRQLEAMGYQGVFALEYAPALTPSESLRR